MRRLAILVSVALLTVVGITATSQAYYLDAPHNESNGIFCYNCHSMSFWKANPASWSGDSTLRNSVCLQCHAEGSVDPKRGPTKKLHASSTTSIKFGTWTTECTQCHSVHYQGQLDWATTEPVYLATGTVVAKGNFVKPDPTYSPTFGSTTFTVSGITGTGWDDTSKWTSKGGLIPGSRSELDGTRGLIFVPDINATGNYPKGLETYEIIHATTTTVVVKGNVKTSTLVGKTFGVIYGQLLKSFMMPNGGTAAADMKNVKFFKPAIIANDAGGYIDKTPGALEPEGLCQVCHNAPGMFALDNYDILQHKAGQVCNSCHNVINGGSPEVIKIHTTYVTDAVGGKCVGCHAGYVNDPDSSHVYGCAACHVSGNPNLSSNNINNTKQVINETVGIFSLNALLTAGYTYNEIPVGSQARVRDADGTDINGVGGNLSFTKITCDTCHVSKPGKVDNGTHGGHPDTDFVWSAGCADLGCHGPNTLNIVKNIHGNGTVGTCTICHDPTSVAAGNYTVRRAGDPTFGIDGTAVGMTRLSTCLNCHSVNTPGVVHHTSKNNYAGLGQCTTVCHNVAGHNDHAAELATYVNCNSCHADVVGSASGAPVQTVADPKKHDSCQTCHTNLGGLKTKAGDYPTSTKITTIYAGLSGSGDGGGTCFACHGDYFATHTHSHAASVTTTSLCGTCHTTLVGNTVTDAKTHVNRCVDCHDMVTGARVNGSGASTYLGTTNVGDATVNLGAGGTCATCHTAYFNGHIHAHAFTTVDAACALCHGATLRTGSTAYKSVTSPYTASGEVHGVSSCGTCHELTTGALKGSAVGKTITTTTCIGCHAATWTVMHTKPSVTHTTHVINTTGSCDTCHGNPTPATSDARDAVATPFMGTGEVHTTGCAACHNADGSNRTTGLIKANTVARGNCTACHTTAWNVIHATTTISHNVTGVTLCNTCHSGDTVSATATHKNACADCHNLTTGARVDGSGIGTYLGATNVGDATVNSGGGGTCSACHAGYFNAHRHNHANFVVTTSCATNCHAATDLATSNARYAATSPWIAAGQVHATGCGLCHDLTVAGALKGSAVGKLNNASCVNCHTPTWEVMHTAKTGVSHATRVDALTTCTSTCHTATAGGAAGLMPVDPGTSDAANKVHDYCTTCHTVAGAMLGGNTTYGALPIVKGDCGTCHGAAYFNSHIHTHTIAQGATDLSQAGPGQLCSVCHVPSPSGLITWASVYAEHLNSCSKCHSEPRAEVTSTITAGADPTRCLSCHSTKTQPATHGGHSADFGKTASCTTSCHTGASVLTDIHSNNCAMCHNGSPLRTNVDALLVANAANGIDGDATLAAGAAPSSWGTKNCLTCHTAGTGANTFGSPGGMHHDNKTNGVVTSANCTIANCHTASMLTHTNSVANDATCNTCHDGVAGGTARNAISSPYIATGSPAEVHYAKGQCTACHQINATATRTGDLRTVAGYTMSNNATLTWVNGTDGGGNCSACHGAHTFPNHIADHTTRVKDTLNSCNTVGCHTEIYGTATTVLLNAATPDRRHNTCFDCHNTNGSYKTVGYGTRAQAMPVGGGNCTACHTTFVLANHTNHSHLITYNATNDKSVGAGTSCGVCHIPTVALTLTTWAGIYEEHLSNCNTCHAYPGGTSPPTATNTSLIQNSTASTCVTCHTEKAVGQPDHNLHPFDFSTTGTTCTTTCHTGASVLLNIHGNGTVATCTMCHTGTPANRDNEGAGPVANGIDGDARGASGVAAAGTWSTTICTACHTAGANSNNFTSVGGMHHDNKTNGVVTSANCTIANCHTASKLTHTSSVATDTKCSSCHKTAAGGTAARLATTSPYILTGEVHISKGACTACHTIQATPGAGGILRTTGLPANLVLSNGASEAWVNGTNGGGTCGTCHKGPAAADYFASHTNASHSARVSMAAGSCDSATALCHTSGVAGTATTVPLDAAATEAGHRVHDTCASCHLATTGLLVTAPGTKGVTTMAGGTAATNDGGGSCTACHTAYTLSNHTHPHTDVVYNATTDKSQNGATSCGAAGCHIPSGLLTTWTGIQNEHTGGCVRCHTYSNADGQNSPPLTTNNTVIASNGSTVNCLTCHTEKGGATTHGGHDITQFPWASLSPGTVGANSCGRAGLYKTGFVNGFTCHDDTAAVVGTVHNGTRATALGSSCLLCHATAAGGDGNMRTYNSATMLGNPSLGVGSNAAHSDLTCITCHTLSKPQLHHSQNTNARAGLCINCHMPRMGTQGNPIATRNTVMLPTNLACNWCHLWWPNNLNYMSNATDNGYNTTLSGNGRVMMYQLNFAPTTYQRQSASTTAVASHAVATNATQPIDDYGACFACHGASGSDNGPADTVGVPDMVKPYHGIGDPITTVVADTLAVGANSTPNKHIQNFIAGAQQTTANGVEKMIPYHPGYGAFNLLATDVGLNQGGKTKPYATDNSSHKFIHDSERTIRSWALRNTDLGTTSSDIEWNNYGTNKGSVGSITFNTGGVAGQKTKNTTVPLVPLAIPSNVKAR